MKRMVLVSGTHAGLAAWVGARLRAEFADQLDVLDAAAAPPAARALCWVLLDPDAARPTRPDVRVVDWCLLGASLLRDAAGASDLAGRLGEALQARVDILRALLDVPAGPPAGEFHASLRVADLPRSVAFYAWLLDTWPREWTARYATFLRADLKLNFVLLVADGKTLHQDTLYHLGIAQADSQAIIATYHRARELGAQVVKPPRTTWRGTPLHELWLADPDGTLIEVYARLTPQELARMPADQAPEFLVPGTGP